MNRTATSSSTVRPGFRAIVATLLSIAAALGSIPHAHATGCARGSPLLHVPLDCDLQTAIDDVGDGGVIEVAAGTYMSPEAVAPTYGYGFRINNEGKGFTIRGVGSVYLDGGGTRDILQIQNYARSNGKPVTFDHLTFRNGFSSSDGVGGGVTIMYGDAHFVDCTFDNNVGTQYSTGGGAMLLGGSVVSIRRSTFTRNTAKNEGGAISVKGGSSLTVGSSTFSANRVDVPNHRINAAGGAIHVGDSYLSVDGSTFEGNRAGYVGGAIFLIGTWAGDADTPNASAYIWNSTFRSNLAQRDPSVSWNVPTEAGAVHAEDQSLMSVRFSNFENNSAGIGGAVNGYRAKLIVDASYFRDNKATATGSGTGFGGAISATSNDTQGFDGDVNRPSISLQVSDSLFEATGNVSQMAGAIYAAGDSNREYGSNGVSQQSSAANNRATVRITGSAFHGLTVTQVAGAVGSGVGAAVLVDLVDLRIENSIFTHNFADGLGASNSNSSGNNGSGAGVTIINNSNAVITGTVFADNVADKWGGAAFLQGSNVVIQHSTFSDNDIQPEVAESADRAYGSALFSAPDRQRGFPATGRVEFSLISGNNSLHIWDDDDYTPSDGPINDMRYNGNTFWGSGFGDMVYRDPILTLVPTGTRSRTVAELNALNVVRIKGHPNTEKSQIDNIAATAEPTAAKLLVFPQIALDNAAVPVCAIYAWQSTNAATLNGAPLAHQSGVTCTTPSERGAVASHSFVLTVDSVTVSDSAVVLTPTTYVPLAVR